VVLEGTLTVAIGGIIETLNTGDSLFFRADADHGFANRTNAPCEYIMVISRRTGSPQFAGPCSDCGNHNQAWPISCPSSTHGGEVP
jgi:uncharacterized cupin superfamily protein